MNRYDPERLIGAATGTALSAKSWLTEAPLRMLMNNLDPDVAEHPEGLVVYGGIGRAARDWESYDRIVAVLRRLEDDQTLLVQSGKPVGVFHTHADAPRVLIANSNLVPRWATWEHFNELDRKAGSLDEALRLIDQAKSEGRAVSVGLLANAADAVPELAERGVVPDALTDQTSAHDPLNGYVPRGWSLAQTKAAREKEPDAVVRAAMESMALHVRGMLSLQEQGAVTFDYGNNLRQMAKDEGVDNAFAFPGFVPAYIRPLFCEGIGPFRWVALSGDPEDIYATDARVKELIPDDAHLHKWLDMARERTSFQGLPARICWVGLADRARLGLAFNEMVASGELKAPVVIGRDHLDSGSVASPNRETEGMPDGSDAVSDWAFLNALLNTASGATWVSIHHGGGVGMGYSQHAGLVIVCDGSQAAARRIARVLWNDPATGVMRHADAGYELAVDCARRNGLDLPMVDTGGEAP